MICKNQSSKPKSETEKTSLSDPSLGVRYYLTRIFYLYHEKKKFKLSVIPDGKLK